MKNLETERLLLRKVDFGDTEFIVELLNDPSFIQNIGDRGVRTTDNARKYLENYQLLNKMEYGKIVGYNIGYIRIFDFEGV